MSQIEIPSWQEMGIAMPSNMNLLQWAGVINASNYFLGCDSVGQHLAIAVAKPATVVLGSTYPENISYLDVNSHTIIDLGKTKRIYSPIRLSMDVSRDRQNEDAMIVEPTQVKDIVQSIKKEIGVSKTVAPKPELKTPNISQDNKPKIPKITKSGQSITKKLLTPPKPVAGFNKSTVTKPSKKKPIDKLVEMELNKESNS